MNRVALGLATLVATAAVAGCGSSSSSGSAPAPAGTGSVAAALIPGCTPDSMSTLKSGALTIATDQPVYSPWYLHNDPSNGKGFEGALNLAIAKELGYTPAQIHFVHETFDQAIAPGPKNFDFELDEFSITPAREKVVDFSAPYYTVTQAVITTEGSKASGVTTVDGLKPLKLGAQIGSTSYTAITDQIKPSSSPAVYNSNSDALQALKNHQIDALVVDLPTAFYMTSAQLDNGVIVGQLPDTGAQPEQFGALLNKNSPLTSCVSKAVEALRTDGTLAQIQDKWLAQAGKAPVLQ
ncbi:MAG TPA: transporter substrate-binding domain-containing protein [Mycobacteriales bacterium]|nr:transporter substrate-binding domain-containing protein [Mycobacteriales bacterium]